MAELRAITLRQPWATLVAIGAKRIETRSWATTYRGPLAIASAKAFPGEEAALCARDPFRGVLTAAGYTSWARLPLGAFLAVVTLADIHQIDTSSGNCPQWADLADHEPERSFGGYDEGRFMWLLSGRRQIDPLPVPSGFHRGIWRVPADVLQ